jgi:casein kinase II subunit alpha
LLLGYELYDYAADVWSAGCVFAGLIFGDEPFFFGSSDTDDLVSIAAVLGTNSIDEWSKAVGLKLSPIMRKALGRKTPTPFSEFVTPKFAKHASKDALDLLTSILVVDPRERLSIEKCLAHPYFKGCDDLLSHLVNVRP